MKLLLMISFSVEIGRSAYFSCRRKISFHVAIVSHRIAKKLEEQAQRGKR